ncbi:MAG: hypothetical protein J7494_03970 [Sphingobium sp.]|nr:hypothetical protein [Sphingobium sp.]
MTQTSVLCRAQEALHRDRAANAELENVRSIALRAAEAWSREAARIEKRRTSVEMGSGQTKVSSLDRLFSENPDHGLAG